MDEAARKLDEAFAEIAVTHPGTRRREPSAAEQAILVKYWGTGRPIVAMAKAFGVAENTLRRWAREAGLL